MEMARIAMNAMPFLVVVPPAEGRAIIVLVEELVCIGDVWVTAVTLLGYYAKISIAPHFHFKVASGEYFVTRTL